MINTKTIVKMGLMAGLTLLGSSSLLGCSSNSSVSFNGSPQVVTLAQGLNSPRGLALGPDGNLYITEAGVGPAAGFDAALPSIPSPGGDQIQFGSTGSLTRVTLATGVVERILTGLPSLAVPEGFNGNTTATEAVGPNDIVVGTDGRGYLTIGLGANPADRSVFDIAQFGGLPNQLGALATVDLAATDPAATLTYVTDLAAFETTTNPDGGAIDSNPFGVALQGSTLFFTDAGGNSLLQSGLDGSGLALKVAFSDVRLVPNPFAPGEIPMQQVPTGLTVGPDGAVYVPELTGFPFPVGAARIFQVVGSSSSVFQSGFTNLIDVAFDSQGNLWALEYDSDSLLGPNTTGSLIRIDTNGQRSTILDTLSTPTGLAIGSNGTVYISNQGDNGGSGEVLKVTF